MKASDIPDVVMLEVVKACGDEMIKNRDRFMPKEFFFSTGKYDGDPWVMTWDAHKELERRIGEVPFKVFMAKFRNLCQRKIMDGCPCGCRGDMQITLKGKDLMEATNASQD